uniref:Si:ch211-266i6.3 n=1 Tax=Sparus aurata TaxID=8175 RepID=A0A671VNX6_SPAAU
SGKTATVPLQLKGNEKEETMGKNGPLKAKAKKAETRVTSGVQQRQTHSRCFLTEKAVKVKKIAAEAPKPPAAVPLVKSAPGMYKGKIVQSKIGSIWKSSATLGGADPKPSAPKTESQRVGHVTKIRSNSVTDIPGHGTQKPTQTRSKSVLDRPAQMPKPTIASHPPAGFYSARPPARTVPATLTSTSTRNANVAFTKRSGTQNSKPKIPLTDKNVSKPPVTSTVSQYRFTMESAEERRAKLADWLASKGKTLKNPATTSVAPPKTKVCAKPTPDSAAAAALCADTQGAELTTQSQTPVMMNTTLDLLENSDADLPVIPQEGVEDIVVNLCDALEALATPSSCNNGTFSYVCPLGVILLFTPALLSFLFPLELSQVTDVCNDVELMDGKPKDECEKEELKNKMSEDVSEKPKVEQVKDEVEENDDQGVETDDEDVESDDECVMETTPEMEDASVVKYSVKTTPFLQSVKKTIAEDVSRSASRRKSNIKDLKFLTPVRRSCRIERKSSRLPTMLLDHDPCVSSLAELVKLDDSPNAYICRKNPALMEDLPDQPRL